MSKRPTTAPKLTWRPIDCVEALTGFRISSLSPAAYGAYERLRNRAWLEENAEVPGGLPNEPKRLANAIGARSVEEFESIWAAIKDEFPADADALFAAASRAVFFRSEENELQFAATGRRLELAFEILAATLDGASPDAEAFEALLRATSAPDVDLRNKSTQILARALAIASKNARKGRRAA